MTNTDMIEGLKQNIKFREEDIKEYNAQILVANQLLSTQNTVEEATWIRYGIKKYNELIQRAKDEIIESKELIKEMSV